MNAITRNELVHLDAPVVEFTLNGQPVTARASETLIEVADREGVSIPRLCYKPGMDTAGNCRACMVEINGERTLAPSCCRFPTAGMQVTTDSERALHAQRMVLERVPDDAEPSYLTAADEAELLDWDAEKYRQALASSRAG